jgi:hypothetical protein
MSILIQIIEAAHTKNSVGKNIVIYKICDNILIIVKLTKDIRKRTLGKNLYKYFSCEQKLIEIFSLEQLAFLKVRIIDALQYAHAVLFL